jgi:hypothetical protein
MDHNAPMNQLMVPIHVPQSIGPRNLVLLPLNHSALAKDSSQGINTMDGGNDPLLL